MCGEGVLKSGDVSYQGEFQDNLPHGKGKQWQGSPDPTSPGAAVKFTDAPLSGLGGGTYEGEWARGLKDGYGCYKSADGTVYEGEYSRDVKCGTGTLRWPDGQVYTGMLLNGKRHGAGKTRCVGVLHHIWHLHVHACVHRRCRLC